VKATGVGKRTEGEVEKRAPCNRHERLPAGLRRRCLCAREGGARGADPHARAAAARQDDGLHMCTISSGAVVFQRPRVKSGMLTGWPPFATDSQLVCTTALNAAASYTF